MEKFFIFCLYCIAIYFIYRVLKDMIPDPIQLRNTTKLFFYTLIALGISINLFKI